MAKTQNRVLAWVLSLALALTLLPVNALAEGDTELEHLPRCGYQCNHVCDEEVCGYVEAVEGSPCTHTTHDESCGYDGENEATCNHTHDDGTCGYVAAVEGASCNHVHSAAEGCVWGCADGCPVATAEAKAEADQAAADAVIALINKLPEADELTDMDDELFSETAAAIGEASNAYDTLSDAQKDLVTNYGKLEALLDILTPETNTIDESGTEETQPVAQIGETQYATLDEAVEKAEEGSAIVLLQDCELTKGFNKTLTFTGNGKITINKQLTSNGEGWMCFGLYDSSRVLTFDGSGIEVEWTSVGPTPWLMLSLSGTLNVANGAKLTFMFDNRTTQTRNAIYMNAGSKINVTNGSTLQILGLGTEGNSGQGIQLDQTGQAEINVTGNSTFLIDGTNRGYVNSPTIYVQNSSFSVINCTSNGSNGGEFTAINSEIRYEDNLGHGLSAGNVTIENSTLNCNRNAYYGITYTGDMTMDSTSVINANENGYGYTGGGLRAATKAKTSSVESGAEINICDNKRNGLENYGTFTVADGAKVTVTGNSEPANGGGIYNAGTLTLPSDATVMNNYAVKTGGGICNAGTVFIPDGVKLYNNHAGTAGDDIYNRANATLRFIPVGIGWALDGDEDELDCNGESHLITGWFDDSETVTAGDTVTGGRWEAHRANATDNHVEEFTEFTDGSATISEQAALKAAHGLGSLTVTKHVASTEKVGQQTFAIQVAITSNGEAATETLYLADEGSGIVSVPIGATYDVTETSVPGYGAPIISGSTGTITENDMHATAVVINIPNGKNALVISKTVEGEGAPADEEFTFTVTLPDGSYPYIPTSADGASTSEGTVGSGGTITLRSGESVVICDLPVGSSYSVTETEHANYTTAVEAVNGTVNGRTVSGTIPAAGTVATAHYTNTYAPPLLHRDHPLSGGRQR